MTSLKILHVISVDKENYYLNNLTDASDEATHLFVTFAPETSDFVRDMKKKGRVAFGLNAMARKRYPFAYRELGRLLAELDPDVVHTHLFDPSVIGLTVAKRHNRRTVVTRHHSDAIHELRSPLKRRFYLEVENYISRNADHIIAPSQMVWEFLVEKEGVDREKVTVIPYGQTTERFDAVTTDKVEAVRHELGMNRGFAFVCVSRLFHRKGHQYLFEAYAELKRDGLKATLFLIGDGDHRETLQSSATALGIAEDVKFLGWRDDALTIMAAADVIVHPSLEDALSSAVIESLMLERPIVATDISGVRDSLDNGKYGKIVRPADAQDFRAGLATVLEQLPSFQVKAKEGRKFLLNYMDSRRVASEYLDIYRKVLAKS